MKTTVKNFLLIGMFLSYTTGITPGTQMVTTATPAGSSNIQEINNRIAQDLKQLDLSTDLFSEAYPAIDDIAKVNNVLPKGTQQEIDQQLDIVIQNKGLGRMEKNAEGELAEKLNVIADDLRNRVCRIHCINAECIEQDIADITSKIQGEWGKAIEHANELAWRHQSLGDKRRRELKAATYKALNGFDSYLIDTSRSAGKWGSTATTTQLNQLLEARSQLANTIIAKVQELKKLGQTNQTEDIVSIFIEDTRDDLQKIATNSRIAFLAGQLARNFQDTQESLSKTIDNIATPLEKLIQFVKKERTNLIDLFKDSQAQTAGQEFATAMNTWMQTTNAGLNNSLQTWSNPATSESERSAAKSLADKARTIAIEVTDLVNILGDPINQAIPNSDVESAFIELIKTAGELQKTAGAFKVKPDKVESVINP